MRLRLFPKNSGTSGQSLVEFCAVLPVLAILVMGVFDLSRAIQASNIITNMSREGANLASRTTIGAQDIMNSIAATAQPLPMGTKGAIYLTHVMQQGGIPTIQTPQSGWRDTKEASLQSRIGQSNVAQVISPISLQEGDSVYIVEVVYNYDFVLFGYSQTLYSFSIF